MGRGAGGRGSAGRETPDRGGQAAALTFYEALQREFPHPSLAAHVEAVRSGTIDHWRNAGVAFVALEAHSRSARGWFSQDMYDRNRARLDELREQYAPDVQFQS